MDMCIKILLSSALIAFALPVIATSNGNNESSSYKNINLGKVSNVVDSICGKLLTKGSLQSTSVNYSLDDLSDKQKSELLKVLNERFDNVQINKTTGIVDASSSKFTGVKQEELAKVNQTIRDCRKEVGLDLIKKQLTKE